MARCSRRPGDWPRSTPARGPVQGSVGQVTGIRVDESTVERIVRVLSTPETRPIDVNRARLERMKRELALDHAAGRLADRTYLAQIAVLRDEATRIDSGERPATGIAPDKVVAKLRALPETWAKATPEGRAELLHSIYERIVVRGPEFVGARLTPEAYSLGLAIALPERVQPATGVGTGAPDRIRTCDLRLRRPTLYPLSYRRANGDGPRSDRAQNPAIVDDGW